MNKGELSIYSFFVLLLLILFSFFSNVSDKITGAAEVFVPKYEKSDKGSFESDFEFYDLFNPSDESLEKRQEEYNNLGLTSNYDNSFLSYEDLSDNGFDLKLSKGNKLLKVYSPDLSLVAEFETSDDEINVKLDEVNIGVYRVVEENLNGKEISEDYFLVASNIDPLTKEEIEERYNIDEEFIKSEYGVADELSVSMFDNLAYAYLIKKTFDNNDFSASTEILKFKDYEKGIFNSLNILNKNQELFFSPINKKSKKTVIREIEFSKEDVMFSPEDNLRKFGIYFSNDVGEIIDEKEIGVIDIFVIKNKPGINLKL